MPDQAAAPSESNRLPGVAVLFRGVGPDRIHGTVDLGRVPPPSCCLKKTLSRDGINDSFGLLFVVGRPFQTPTCATIPLDHAVPRQETGEAGHQVSELIQYMIAFVSGATVTEKGA